MNHLIAFFRGFRECPGSIYFYASPKLAASYDRGRKFSQQLKGKQ